MSVPVRATVIAAALLAFATAPSFADDPVDCSKGDVAAGPAKGTVNGAPFVIEHVTIDPNDKRTQNGITFDEYHIYLVDKGGLEVDFTAITVTGKLPDGRTFRSGLNGDEPEAGPGSPEIQGWGINDKANNVEINFFEVQDGSLQVVFGSREGKSLPATIHFCVPSKSTELSGSFTVPLSW